VHQRSAVPGRSLYHPAKSARNRDRLRQEILEGLDWKLHRIWSTDWFNNPRQEGERLRKVIVDRLAALKAREHEFVRRPQAPVVVPQTMAEASPADDEVRSAPVPMYQSGKGRLAE